MSSNADFFFSIFGMKAGKIKEESSALQMDEGRQVWYQSKEGAWQCYKSYSNKMKEPWTEFVLPLSLQKNSTPCEKWYADRWKNLPSAFPFPGMYPAHMDNTCTRFPKHCCTQTVCYWFSQVTPTGKVRSPAWAGCALLTDQEKQKMHNNQSKDPITKGACGALKQTHQAKQAMDS